MMAACQPPDQSVDQAALALWCQDWRRRRWLLRSVFRFEIALAQLRVERPPCLDVLSLHVPSPVDAPISDPVVGAAWKIPVADGRPERDTFDSSSKAPLHGRDWGDYLAAAAACASMCRSTEPLREVKDSRVQRTREAFNLDQPIALDSQLSLSFAAIEPLAVV